MKRLMDLIGMTAGGWLGWFLGAPMGIFMAFVISTVGTGFGLWMARRYLGSLLP